MSTISKQSREFSLQSMIQIFIINPIKFPYNTFLLIPHKFPSHVKFININIHMRNVFNAIVRVAKK